MKTLLIALLLWGSAAAHARNKNFRACKALSTLVRAQPLELYAAHAKEAPRDEVNFVFCDADVESLMRAFEALGFFRSDPPTWPRLVRETFAVFADRSYPTAPVSHLYLFGRHEEGAVQEAVGRSPRTRHHARLWTAPPEVYGERVVFMAASFDEDVSIRHFTHKVDPRLDLERDFFAERMRASRDFAFIARLKNTFLPEKARVQFETDGDALLYMFRGSTSAASASAAEAKTP